MESKSKQEKQAPKSERSQEEMAKEFKRLKARHEWIKMNQKYLDQIQSKQLFYHRLIFAVVVFHLLFNLICLIL
jgi:hypothetical protein